IDEEIAAAKKKLSTFKSETTTRLRGDARPRAVDYLLAATEFDQETTFEAVVEIAKRGGLHPHILKHSRRHLEFHRDDPVFSHWWAFHEKGDHGGLEAFFEGKFEAAVLAFEAQREVDPKAKTLEDPQLEPFRAALFDNSGFLAVPARPVDAFTEEDYRTHESLAEKARLLESAAPDHSAAMGLRDREKIASELPIHIRGSHLNLGDSVPRALPAVFEVNSITFPEDQSGRLELARWIADPQNPLTARVIVNRVWRWHFGEGLVASTDNFGILGDRPSHPELLDWLANWFVDEGWSIKALNRLIMTSKAYSRSSRPVDPAVGKADPKNRLLAYFPPRRLEAEAIRDSILAISGRLDQEMGGKTIPLRNRQMVFNHTSKDHTSYDSLRRTVYLPVIRNHVHDWLHLFDYPDPTMPTGDRPTTTVAPQALLLLNSKLATESAEAFAARARRSADTDTDRLTNAWRMAYGSRPSQSDLDAMTAFLESGISQEKAWPLLCQSLLASNRFSYLP
ncbi:MAG: DUF1553 domain-containing protein, partial [Verrucomicrobiota bacterium]